MVLNIFGVLLGEECRGDVHVAFLQPSIQLPPAALPTAQIDPVMAKKVLECRH